MAEEKIIIDVQVQATKAIKDIADANTKIQELRKTNNELSKDYAKNSEAIAINQQEIKRLTTTVNTNTKTVQAAIVEVNKEQGAYQALSLKYALAAQRAKDLSAAYGVNSKQAKEASKLANELGNQLKEIDSTVGQGQRNIGNYGEALDKAGGAFGGLGSSIVSTTKAALAFIATPIGLALAALVAVMYSVKLAFEKSEEGQDRWAKLTQISKGIIENFTDELATFGMFLIKAFEDPKAAIKDFGEFFKSYVSNRIEGLFELLPALGKAITQIFKGEVNEGLKTAADAAIKVGLGIENASEKVKKFTDEQIKEAAVSAKIADMKDKADEKERDLIVKRSLLESKIADLRLKARTEDEYTAKERKKFLEEAMALDSQLISDETTILKLKKDAVLTENKLRKANTEEAKRAAAEAVAAVNSQVAKELDAKRAYRKELNKINKQITAEDEAVVKAKEEQIKKEQEALILLRKAQKDIGDLINTQSEREKRLIKEKYSSLFDSLVKYNNEVAAEYKLTDEQIALEKAKIKEQEAKELKAIDEKITAAEKAENEKRIQADKDAKLKKIDTAKDYADKSIAAVSAINDFANSLDAAEIQNAEVKSKREEDILNTKLANGQITEAFYTAKKAENERKLDKEKAKIQRNAAIRGKAIASIQAGIDTAGAIIKSLVNPGGVAGVALSILAGITGAAQIAAINAAPLPKASRGAYLATGNKHSQGGIKYELERGESVINARSTEMFAPLLSAMNEAGGGVKFAAGGYNGDGGFAARSLMSTGGVGDISQMFQNMQFKVSVEDINRGQGNYASVTQAGIW